MTERVSGSSEVEEAGEEKESESCLMLVRTSRLVGTGAAVGQTSLLGGVPHCCDSSTLL